MKLSAEKIVKLLQVKGIGKGKIFSLLKMIPEGSIDDELLSDLIIENSTKLKVDPTTKSDIFAAFLKGQELYDLSIEKNIKFLTYDDIDFPKSLKNISNPPILLSAIGNYKALNSMPGVAVIGTREPSDYGRQIGERIGYILGENGINVVSGLAIGCDTAGHIGCLRAKGTTTAVLAHGLDTIYPKENSGLAQSIIDNNGCLLSEYLIKTRGLPNYFIERDRIQAGLSNATVVVETDIKGGTMHTVKFTREYGRKLAAFFHPIEKRNQKSRGNEMLVNEGTARKIENLTDINDLICDFKPSLPTNDTPSFGSIEGVQMPLLNLDDFTVRDYQYSTAKKKPKKKKGGSPGNVEQTKIYEE